MSGDFFSLVILPLLIFLARICDVSLGTLRILFLAKGERVLVPLLGFFEVLIWITAVGQVMQNVTNLYYYLAYASGFAMGNYVGIIIDDKLAIGRIIFRIITRSNDDTLIEALLDSGVGVTWNEGEGSRGPVKIIFTVVDRKQKQKILGLLNTINPKPFFTIDDVKTANNLSTRKARRRVPDSKKYDRAIYMRRRKEK